MYFLMLIYGLFDVNKTEILYKSSENINEKRDGPYRVFGYLSLFSDSLDLAKRSQRAMRNTVILQLSAG